MASRSAPLHLGKWSAVNQASPKRLLNAQSRESRAQADDELESVRDTVHAAAGSLEALQRCYGAERAVSVVRATGRGGRPDEVGHAVSFAPPLHSLSRSYAVSTSPAR